MQVIPDRSPPGSQVPVTHAASRLKKVRKSSIGQMAKKSAIWHVIRQILPVVLLLSKMKSVIMGSTGNFRDAAQGLHPFFMLVPPLIKS